MTTLRFAFAIIFVFGHAFTSEGQSRKKTTTQSSKKPNTTGNKQDAKQQTVLPPTTYSVAITSDGGLIAANTAAKGAVTLWDGRDGTQIGEVPQSSGSKSVALSPSGGTILVGSATGEILAVKTSTNEVLWKRRVHQGAIRSLTTNAAGETIASVGVDGQVFVTRSSDGSQVSKMVGLRGAKALSAALSPKGDICLATYERTVVKYDAQTGEMIADASIVRGGDIVAVPVGDIFLVNTLNPNELDDVNQATVQAIFARTMAVKNWHFSEVSRESGALRSICFLGNGDAVALVGEKTTNIYSVGARIGKSGDDDVEEVRESPRKRTSKNGSNAQQTETIPMNDYRTRNPEPPLAGLSIAWRQTIPAGNVPFVGAAGSLANDHSLVTVDAARQVVVRDASVDWKEVPIKVRKKAEGDPPKAGELPISFVAVAFTHESNLVALARRDSPTILLLDAVTLKEQRRFQLENASFRPKDRLVFLQGGKSLGVFLEQGTTSASQSEFHVLDSTNGQQVANVNLGSSRDYGHGVHPITDSLGERVMFLGAGRIRSYNVTTKRMEMVLPVEGDHYFREAVFVDNSGGFILFADKSNLRRLSVVDEASSDIFTPAASGKAPKIRRLLGITPKGELLLTFDEGYPVSTGYLPLGGRAPSRIFKWWSTKHDVVSESGLLLVGFDGTPLQIGVKMNMAKATEHGVELRSVALPNSIGPGPVVTLGDEGRVLVLSNEGRGGLSRLRAARGVDDEVEGGIAYVGATYDLRFRPTLAMQQSKGR